MKSKIMLSLIIGLILIVALAACGGGAAAPTTAPAAQATTAPASTGKTIGPDTYIPVISKGFQHQFWQSVKAGSEKAAKDFNVKITFEGPESESQVDKQIEMLQAALNKKPAAICLAALDSKAAVPLLQQAKSQGIPVIGFDSGVDSDIPATTAATDNVAAAANAADHMAQLIGDSGEVAVLVHDQTSRTGIDRRDGFVNQMKSKHPNVQIVDVQYGAGDPQKSTDIAKAVMQGHPNLKGYFGANEGSMKGVMNAAKELGKEGKIVMIGYDAGKQLKDEVRSGVVAGAITQDPVQIGYKCVESAIKAIKGEKLSKVTDTGFKWWDKTNMDDPAIAPLLYD